MMYEMLAKEVSTTRYDSLAATVGPKLNGIRKQNIRESFSTIHHVEHRLEYVATVHGKDFINDSVSSTINSTWYALEHFHRPIVWIAGGINTGRDYTSLVPQVCKKVRAIVCLGLDNSAIHEAFRDRNIPLADCRSMEEAVEKAFLFGEKGDIVLFSPASPSFDLFKNYEDRGAAFRRAVKQL